MISEDASFSGPYALFLTVLGRLLDAVKQRRALRPLLMSLLREIEEILIR